MLFSDWLKYTLKVLVLGKTNNNGWMLHICCGMSQKKKKKKGILRKLQPSFHGQRVLNRCLWKECWSPIVWNLIMKLVRYQRLLFSKDGGSNTFCRDADYFFCKHSFIMCLLPFSVVWNGQHKFNHSVSFMAVALVPD